MVIVFSAAIAMSVLGALISLLRGKQFYYAEPEAAGAPVPGEAVPVGAVPAAAVPEESAPDGALPDRVVPDRA